MDGVPPKKQRGSAEIWLNAAHGALTELGVDAVTISELSRRTGLTRTSFYWHFKDREALLDALVICWEQKNTGNLITRAEAYAESVTEAMFNLFDCWLDPDLFDADFDLAIRNWARNDTALQGRLDLADAKRFDAISRMFERFDYAPIQAQVRSRSILYTQIGYISMQISEDWQQRISRMPAYIEVFTGHRPRDGEIRRFEARHRSRDPRMGDHGQKGVTKK